MKAGIKRLHIQYTRQTTHIFIYLRYDELNLTQKQWTKFAYVQPWPVGDNKSRTCAILRKQRLRDSTPKKPPSIMRQALNGTLTEKGKYSFLVDTLCWSGLCRSRACGRNTASKEGEFTRDGTRVNCKVPYRHFHTYRQFSVANLPTCMFLDHGKKPENLVKHIQNSVQRVSWAHDQTRDLGAVRQQCYLTCRKTNFSLIITLRSTN